MRVRGMEQELAEFAEFYESTREDCLRIVLLNVGDRQLAQTRSEAYTRAWMSWRKVRALDVPRAWVVRIALNTHVSWWRRRRREVAPWRPRHCDACRASHHSQPGDLLAALRRLPARQREVVTLRLLLDMDTETTARVLGIAPGTVSAHLHQAVAKLRAAIPSHYGQEISK